MKHINPINEQKGDSYSKNCQVELYYSGSSFRGNEINDITADPIRISFDIEIEAREWGIKGISICNIKGPDELTLNVSFYEDSIESEFPNEVDTTITILLDWNSIEIEEYHSNGPITVDEIYLELSNDNDSELLALPNGELRRGGEFIIKSFIARCDL